MIKIALATLGVCLAIVAIAIVAFAVFAALCMHPLDKR